MALLQHGRLIKIKNHLVFHHLSGLVSTNPASLSLTMEELPYLFMPTPPTVLLIYPLLLRYPFSFLHHSSLFTKITSTGKYFIVSFLITHIFFKSHIKKTRKQKHALYLTSPFSTLLHSKIPQKSCQSLSPHIHFSFFSQNTLIRLSYPIF